VTEYIRDKNILFAYYDRRERLYIDNEDADGEQKVADKAVVQRMEALDDVHSLFQ